MLTITTPPNTYDLTTLETIKAELKITTNTNDPNLIRWIHEASEIVATYCGRVFGLQVMVETQRDCWGKEELILEGFPIVTITSIVEDGVTLDNDEFEVDADAGLIYRLDDDFRICWQGDKVVVTYSAGYDLLDAVPRDLERAVIEMIKLQYFGAQRDPLARSVDVPGVMSKTYWVGTIGDNGALPPSVTALLDPFRRGDKGLR